MTAHIYHPDTHEYGLFDECPRCQEHAEHPEWSLDSDNVARLLRGDLFSELDRKAAERLARLRHPSNGAVKP